MNKALSKYQFVLLFSLYTTQYMGLAYFTEAFVAILRKNGLPLEHLSIIYMLGLLWVLRFLWAPLIDSISFKKIGHYKGWIIIFQSLMTLILFATSFFDLLTSLLPVVVAAALFSFCSASQAIALDALVYKSVSEHGRTTAIGIKAAGGMVGMVLGGGVGLILYDYIGWSWTMMILALSTLTALLLLVRFKEPMAEKARTNEVNYKQFITFWSGKRRKQWLAFLIFYPVTICAAYALVKPMLVDLGWELGKIGLYVHVFGYSLGVLSSLFASRLINRYGKRNILMVAAFGQIVGLALLLTLAYGYDNPYLAVFVVGFVFSFYSPSAVVMSNLMMDEASEVSPASQFAIQHSIHMFSGIFFSSLAVFLSGTFGYATIIIGGCAIGVLVLISSFKIELIQESRTEELVAEYEC